MRLIDADALIEEARELHIDDFMLVMAMANKQPTAYDVEKVVAELEKEKEIVKEYEEYHCSVRLDKAIDIVKRGGIEGGNNGWILTEERLPDNNRCVLIKAESTTIAGGTIIAVGACHNGFWFVQSGLDTLSFPCNGYKVVKWRELPKE